MKKIFFFFFLLLNFLCSASEFDVIAKVDEKIITKYDFDVFSNTLKNFLKNNNLFSDLNEKDILDLLIEKILKEKAVENEKIIFDKEEFNYYLENIKKKDEIKKNDNDIYYDIYKNNFLWSKLIEEKIKRRIFINDAEVNDILEFFSKDLVRTRYNISQIVLYKNKEKNPKNIIDKLYSEIKEKNNFEYIAEKFSQDDNKYNKGYIGWIDETEINSIIFEKIKNLSINSITEPIYIADDDSESGFYIIIKLNDKKKDKVIEKEDIIRIQNYLYNQKLTMEIKKYIDILYNNSYIEKSNF